MPDDGQSPYSVPTYACLAMLRGMSGALCMPSWRTARHTTLQVREQKVKNIMSYLHELLGVRPIGRAELAKRLREECAWTVSAKGPHGLSVRTEVPKGTTEAGRADAIAIASAKIATKESREGLSAKQTLASRDRDHSASASGNLATMSMEAATEATSGFAGAFGASVEAMESAADLLRGRYAAPQVLAAQALAEREAEQLALESKVRQVLRNRAEALGVLADYESLCETETTANLRQWLDELAAEATVDQMT